MIPICPTCQTCFIPGQQRLIHCCGNRIPSRGIVERSSPLRDHMRKNARICHGCEHAPKRGCLKCDLAPQGIKLADHLLAGGGCFDVTEPRFHPWGYAPHGKDQPRVLAQWANPIRSGLPFQFLIKSILRWSCVLRLVRSIKRWYPSAEIFIADDSWQTLPAELPEAMQKTLKIPGVHWWQLEFDYGLPATRNFLARCATAPYLINCDDDFVFTRETRVEDLVSVLEANPRYDVACGLVRMDGHTASKWHGDFRFVPDGDKHLLRIDPPSKPWQCAGNVWYREMHLGFNFLAARRHTLVNHPADPHFRIVGEHLDRFLDWHQKGIRVVEVPQVIAGHANERPEGYVPMRRRMKFHTDLVGKWGLSKPPNHPAAAYEGIAPLDVRQEIIDQLRSRPNIVLLTVGHTGSTVVAKMLGALGWNLADADDEYAESISVRTCNQRGDWSQADKIIQGLGEPWVIKDPRFCEHLHRWHDALRQFRPTLIWLRRDRASIEASFRRRGESVSLLRQRIRSSQDQFNRWLGPKMVIDYEQVQAATQLFQSSR